MPTRHWRKICWACWRFHVSSWEFLKRIDKVAAKETITELRSLCWVNFSPKVNGATTALRTMLTPVKGAIKAAGANAYPQTSNSGPRAIFKINPTTKRTRLCTTWSSFSFNSLKRMSCIPPVPMQSPRTTSATPRQRLMIAAAISGRQQRGPWENKGTFNPWAKQMGWAPSNWPWDLIYDVSISIYIYIILNIYNNIIYIYAQYI